MVFVSRQKTPPLVVCVAGSFVLLVAIGLHILCMVTSYFFILSDSSAREAYHVVGGPNIAASKDARLGIHYGLWEICVGQNMTSYDYQCVQMVSPGSNYSAVKAPDWLTAPRALSIVGLLVASAGVLSVVAFILTKMSKLPYLFLVIAASSCISGGILILSGDIAFAAEKTLDFYAENPLNEYLFRSQDSPERKAFKLQVYDNEFVSGWSFILDLISGCLCIVSGPAFVFVAMRLQWIRNKYSEATGTHSGKDMTSSL